MSDTFKTTVNISDPVYKAAKRIVQLERIPFGAFVERALRRELGESGVAVEASEQSLLRKYIAVGVKKGLKRAYPHVLKMR